ncbi:MAG TPA: acetate kinase [Aquabacterium sp.]|nr:acetate kinase [Aquabacterium sp.]
MNRPRSEGLLPLIAWGSWAALMGPNALAQTSDPSASSVASAIEQLQEQLAEQARQIQALKHALEEQEARRRAGQQGGNRPAPEDGQRMVNMGRTPEPTTTSPPPVAPLFEQPGILTPKGQFVLEPSVQYLYASSNRVALVGYTIIPSLLIGLVDVREVKRNTVTAALTGRYGLSNRFEVEAKVPYVYRSDSTISREYGGGASTDTAFSSKGQALGDIELAARYQLNQGSGNIPYWIGSLRFKSRTGKDPFEVVTDCTTRCTGAASGTGLPLDLPTGSGFYSLQPALTWLLPSDPAVFFGGISYTHNFKRTNVSRDVLSGQKEFLGDIEPGNVIGLNFGMGMALNDRASFSMGVDLNSVAATRQNGEVVAGSVRTQLASLLLGYSYRYSEKTTFNLSVGAGLTRDTPDLSISIRIPKSF